ncbi:hypothetical protein CYQ66_12115 [Enterococcus faecium]|nr:hypothetical protein CYQ66_12115 [Enterococcus faecium]
MWLKTLYRKRAVTWPFIFYTIIWTLSKQKYKKYTQYVNKMMNKSNFFRVIYTFLFSSEHLF